MTPHVFSLTVAAVDAKRGYVGMCNGRSAQQESGAALSKNSMFMAGAKIIYSYYTRCALIRDRQPTALDDFHDFAQSFRQIANHVNLFAKLRHAEVLNGRLPQCVHALEKVPVSAKLVSIWDASVS